ncbi:MAG: T9SS type A sorting domain-containing protein [Bacteroidales bacterium]|nr:T9SS type A sorting domain-containing protein [Bacteroidales bacterium]
MKKKFYILFLVVFYVQLSVSQTIISNSNFELWDTLTHPVEYPSMWSIMPIVEGGTSIVYPHKVSTDPKAGIHSIMLKTVLQDGGGVIPSILMYGSMSVDQGGLKFEGYPFDKEGDKFYFWYKSGIESGDQAMVMLMLWNDGVLVDSIIYDITQLIIFDNTEGESDWVCVELDINTGLSQVDAMFLAFASSNPWGGAPKEGSWLQIDSMYFTKGSDPTPILVPNHSLEDWTFLKTEDPIDWHTSNSSLPLREDNQFNVSKTSDSYKGDYAVLLENKFFMGDIVAGSLYYKGSITDVPDTMFVAYKFEPTGSEQVFINVSFYEDDTLHIGSFIDTITEATSTYQIATMDFDVYGNPNQIEISISMGRSTIGSKLWVDFIRFDNMLPDTTRLIESICEGDAFYFDGNYIDSTGVYEAYYENLAGMDSVVYLELTVYPYPDNTVTQDGNTLTANEDDASYQWVDCNNNYSPIEGENNKTFTTSKAGRYAVIVTKNNCSDTSECYVITVGVSHITYDTHVNLYPNPSQGQFLIDLGSVKDKATIKVYSVSGQLITQGVYENQSVLDLNLNVPEGLYFITVESTDLKAKLKAIVY